MSAVCNFTCMPCHHCPRNLRMGSSGVLVQSTIISLCTAKSDGRCQDYDEIKRFNIVDLNLELQGITKIRSLDAFTNLTRLRLNNNNVEIIEGLDRLGKLESIDLSFNKIKRLEGLGSLLALKLLVISHNELSSIANSFTHLQYLEMLVLNSNKLRDFDHLQKCASLRSLSLKSNPLCVNTNYQEHILAVIPNLIYLDGINRAKTRVENTHKGKNETVSNEDQCMAAVCENGEEKRARESRYKAAFVDEWNPEKFFANGFLNKFDHTICNLPGNIENFQEYPFLPLHTFTDCLTLLTFIFP
ncbi:Dynein regulatory complex subunit 3 [Echinococcus granulosus]|nr:Dynein regulatory complex subunit 3 [Echinococcus granulosus]